MRCQPLYPACGDYSTLCRFTSTCRLQQTLQHTPHTSCPRTTTPAPRPHPPTAHRPSRARLLESYDPHASNSPRASELTYAPVILGIMRSQSTREVWAAPPLERDPARGREPIWQEYATTVHLRHPDDRRRRRRARCVARHPDTDQ